MRHVGFGLQMQLCVTGDARCIVGRQAKRFIERVGMQRLRVPGDSSAAFNAGARDIVENILRRKRPARGLAMCAQHQ